jgi:hypothetical protein
VLAREPVGSNPGSIVPAFGQNSIDRVLRELRIHPKKLESNDSPEEYHPSGVTSKPKGRRQAMGSKVSTLIVVLILTGLILSVLIISGCAATTRLAGPQESIGPQEPVGPQGAVGPDKKTVSYTTISRQGPSETQKRIGPQKTTEASGRVGLQEPVGKQRRISPADPVMLVARVLELVGLATKVG